MVTLGTVIMYSPTDVCTHFRIGKAKCLKLFANKDFGAIRLGKKYLVSEENLKKFMSSGKKIWEIKIKKEDLN